MQEKQYLAADSQDRLTKGGTLEATKFLPRSVPQQSSGGMGWSAVSNRVHINEHARSHTATFCA